MAGYDPRRPRPARPDESDAAPIEALLGAVEPSAAEPEAAEPDRGATEPDVGAVDDAPVGELAAEALEPAVDLRAARPVSTGPTANGSGPTGARPAVSDVPIAPAPDEGTANRAVLAAGIVASAVLAVLVVLLLRRRRR